MNKISNLSKSAIVLLLLASTMRAEGVQIDADVVYGHKAGLALTYDVIQYEDNKNGAAVMFMMSGGWFSGWMPPKRFAAEHAPEGYGHFRQLLEKGYTLVIVRHGSAPFFKVPDAVSDVRSAVRHFKHRADEWGVDPDRVGVTGSSAGGHLSLMLGTASDDGESGARELFERTSNRVAAVVAYFPPVDIREIVGPSKSFPALEFDKGRAADVSPLLFVTPDDAPTLLIHGNADQLVPLNNSERMHTAFQEQQVESELIVIEGAEHGFRGEDGRRASSALVEWFDDHLSETAVAKTKSKQQVAAEDTPRPAPAIGMGIMEAAAADNAEAIRKLVAAGSDVNQQRSDNGATPLITAALLGNTAAATELIGQGAKLNLKDAQQSTALHVAAFFAQPKVVKLLLDSGADMNVTNKDGATPLDIVSIPWSSELEGLYKFIAGLIKIEVDLERIKSVRPEVVRLLRDGGGKSGREL